VSIRAILPLVLLSVVIYHGHSFVPTGLAPELDDQDPVLLLAVKYRKQVEEQIQTPPAMAAPLGAYESAVWDSDAPCAPRVVLTSSPQTTLSLLMSRQL
jgi:hypothetical protein